MPGPIFCPGHSRPLAELDYSPVTTDGTFLISACHDKLPMLRNGETGDWIGTFQGHKGAVWSAKLNYDATLAATGSADFSAKVWNAITGAQTESFTHKHIVKAVEFSGDSQKLATGGYESVIRVFDLNEPKVEPTPISLGTRTTISKVVWSKEDTNKILVGSNDGAIRAIDLRTGTEVQKAEVQGSVMDVEMSRSGEILTVAAGNQVSFFKADTLELIRAHSMPMHFREEGGASIHPNGHRFIAGGSDLWVRVFDYETGAELECHKGHHGPVRCLRYSPVGTAFATGSEDGTIRIWEAS